MVPAMTKADNDFSSRQCREWALGKETDIRNDKSNIQCPNVNTNAVMVVKIGLTLL